MIDYTNNSKLFSIQWPVRGRRDNTYSLNYSQRHSFNEVRYYLKYLDRTNVEKNSTDQMVWSVLLLITLDVIFVKWENLLTFNKIRTNNTKIIISNATDVIQYFWSIIKPCIDNLICFYRVDFSLIIAGRMWADYFFPIEINHAESTCLMVFFSWCAVIIYKIFMNISKTRLNQLRETQNHNIDWLLWWLC